MRASSNDLQRDALILLRHIRFIASVFILALIIAFMTGLATDPSYHAAALVNVQTNPSAVGAPQALSVATGPGVERRVMESGKTTDASDLKANVVVLERPGGLTISARGDTEQEAVDGANAWASATAAALNAARGDESSTAALVRRVEIARQGWLDSESSVAATGNDPLAIEERLKAAQGSLTDVESDLAKAEQALAIIRQAVAAGNPSPGLLQAAVAGLAIPPEAIPALQSNQDIILVLELRRNILSSSRDKLSQQVQAIEKVRADLLPLSIELEGARSTYLDAVKSLQAARQGQAAPITSALAQPATVATYTGREMVRRLGAAAAAGLVFGVLGAFGIEFLPTLRGWWRDDGASRRS